MVRWLALTATCAAALTAVSTSGEAHANRLSLAELHAFGSWLECMDGTSGAAPCSTPSATAEYPAWATYHTCRAACAAKYVPTRNWEKDGNGTLDRADLDLAFLEFYGDAVGNPMNFGAEYCYVDAASTVVAGGPLCKTLCNDPDQFCTDAQCALAPVEPACAPGGGASSACWYEPTPITRPARCTDFVCQHWLHPVLPAGESRCQDKDNDGLPNWLEIAAGLSDEAASTLCSASNPCGFDHDCASIAPFLGGGVCKPRPCTGGRCTAFHLEVASQDDQQALIHVHYDHSPVPARMLDLYFDFSSTTLLLQDVRPLASLAAYGKRVAHSILADGRTLRVTVFDETSSTPIPFGPIVELVFQKLVANGDGASAAQWSVGFTQEASLLRNAIAPAQGFALDERVEGQFVRWGPKVLLHSPQSSPTRLALWYGFNDPAQPIVYTAAPTAEQLCTRVAQCSNEQDVATKSRVIARLAALQSGSTFGGQSVTGVQQQATFLDGRADHLTLPVIYNDQDLSTHGQSFSFSTWFYAERAEDALPHVLFAQQTFDERSRFGLGWRAATDKSAIDLFFFDGDLFDDGLFTKGIVPITGGAVPRVPVLSWHHVGFVINTSGPKSKVSLYLDGARVVTDKEITSPPVVCPQFLAGKDVLLHDEGDVLGGQPPEFIYTSVKKNGLYTVVRTDPYGLQTKTVIEDGQHTFRDPDYSPVLDRIAFASNVSGNMEIWVAHGDGSVPRRVTEGFGDAFLGFEARRPRWAPDGSALVFESDAFDTLAQDNDTSKVVHLYYLAWSNDKPTPEAGDRLDYSKLLTAQDVGSFRLTAGATDFNATRAQWITGPSKASQSLGTILYERSAFDFSDRAVYKIDLPVQGPHFAVVSKVLVDETYATEYALLAAHRSVQATGATTAEKRRMLVQKHSASWVADDRLSTTVTASTGSCDAIATVAFSPAGGAYGAQCFDLNGNGMCDVGAEDANGDNGCTVADCYPASLHNVRVEVAAASGYTIDDAQTKVLTSSVTAGPNMVAKAAAAPDGTSASVQVEPVMTVVSSRAVALYQLPSWALFPDATHPVGLAAHDDYLLAIVGEERNVVATGKELYGRTQVPSGLTGVESVAAGQGFALARLTDGTLRAWGGASPPPGTCLAGQTPSAVPVAPTCTPGSAPLWCACQANPTAAGCAVELAKVVAKPIKAIAAGNWHALALQDDGRVIAWGCGAAATVPASLPTDVVAIAAGPTTAWALRKTGDLVGWGTGAFPITTVVANATAIAASADRVVVRSEQYNLGVATVFSPSNPAGVVISPKAGTPLTPRNVVAVAAHAGVASVLTAEGVVYELEPPALALGSSATKSIAAIAGTPNNLFGIQTCDIRDLDGDGTISTTEAATCTPHQALQPPLALSATVARLCLKKKPGASPATLPAVVVKKHANSDQVLVVDLDTANGVSKTETFDADGRFEHVVEAALSPDGERVALAAIVESRPVILRSAPHAADGAWTANGAQPIFGTPQATLGLSWTREDRYFACQWLGAQQHFQTKALWLDGRYLAHHGGVDELKIHLGLRNDASFRSEAERGLDFLNKDVPAPEGVIVPGTCASDADCPAHFRCKGAAGAKTCKYNASIPASQAPACATHVDCPPYQLCDKNKHTCHVVPCDPSKSGVCDALGSLCSLRPFAVPGTSQWVCASDCNADAQCFTRACKSGPCRFCDTETKSCIECKETVKAVGGLSYTVVEGCPDARSWRCEEGTCVSDCYSQQDGESHYICDSTTEYCKGGFCALFDWDWPDFSPASLAGVADMRRVVSTPTTAVLDQNVPISIVAFGNGDYGHPPELLVEARGGEFYGDTWAEIGRLVVHARTSADAAPLTLAAPHPFKSLRVRLVTGAYSDVSGTATGLDKGGIAGIAYSGGPYAQCVKADKSIDSACYARAQSSFKSLGYVVGDRSPLTGLAEAYLPIGAPGAIVSSVTVQGTLYPLTATTVVNTICAPLVAGQYGTVSFGPADQSPWAKACGAACNKPLVTFDASSAALLNCNYFDPNADAGAGLLIGGIIVDVPTPKGTITVDNGVQCIEETASGLVHGCYTFQNDPSLDPQNANVLVGNSEVFQSLQLGLFRSFAYDGGYDEVPLPSFAVTVTGYSSTFGGDAGATIVLSQPGKPDESYYVSSVGTSSHTFTTLVRKGRRFTVTMTPPVGVQRTCITTATETMQTGGATVDLHCGAPSRLAYAVTYDVAPATAALVTVRGTINASSGASLAVAGTATTQEPALTGAAGDPYSVEILSQPSGYVCLASNGAGVLAGGDTLVVKITCTKTLLHALAVQVTGFTETPELGVGLSWEITGALPAKSSEVLPGNSTLALGSFPSGTTYDVTLTQQPDRYPYHCAAQSLSGVLTSGPKTIEVKCSKLATFGVSGTATGLLGSVAVALEALPVDGAAASSVPAPWLQRVDKPASASATSPVPWSFVVGTCYCIAPSCLPGAPQGTLATTSACPSGTHRFTGLQARNAPGFHLALSGETAVNCTVQYAPIVQDPALLGSSEFSTPSNQSALISCSVPVVSDAYVISGSVAGLAGAGGLRLGLRVGQLDATNPSETLDISADASKFTFKTSVSAFEVYRVTIERQPVSKPEVCTVSHESGTVAKKDVTDVAVTCVPGATLTVNVSASANGKAVRAYLIQHTAQGFARELVGVSSGVNIQSGTAAITFKAPNGSGSVALSPGATYSLYVLVNANADFVGTDPLFSTGDLAAVVTFSVPAGTAPVQQPVTVDAAAKVPVVHAVPSAPALIRNDRSLRCFWVAHGTPSVLGKLPATTSDGALGESSATCSAGQPCALDAGALNSKVNPALPTAPGLTYDVACWQDNDGNAVLSANDLIGEALGVSLDAATVTVQMGVKP